MKKEQITIALAGNPNAGKTTIFNAITGAHQHVGNYPGVTVEKKSGTCRYKNHTLTVVDLPGTYSLTAHSIEEVVARNFLIQDKPDVVINVIDASNLERNLYLAVQVMELGIPMILAFNMSDVAKTRGISFDLEQLSSLLGVPIVPTVGNRKEGVDELLEKALNVAEWNVEINRPEIHYGKEIEEAIETLITKLNENSINAENPRWTAIKLLENDTEVMKAFTGSEILETVASLQKHIEPIVGDSLDMIIADHRYGFISGACSETVRSTIEARHSLSDRIDEVMIHRVWGLPIFLGMMYLVFWLTFTIGAIPMGWLDIFFGWLGEAVTGLWPAGSDSVLKSLLVDGIIGGVGGVLIFLPNIMMLFMAIAILEDSGYMARAAFMMDRLMHKIGLHGKSFIPMLTGFGCSVPAIMATRTLETERDRLTTMMVIPLMSCGARLPIYALIIPAFFPEAWQAKMLWLIYIIGIVLAVVCAKLLRSTLFRGETTPFVMELPPYRLPTFKGTLIHMWERAGLYVQKAGTLILAASIILWALTSFPKLKQEDPTLSPEQQQAKELSHTIAGRIGHTIEPIIQPLGFDWRIGTAMIGAFAAKEVFVSQMGIVFAVGDADETSLSLREKLRQNYTPLVGFCIMLFMLISMPCMATVAVTMRESNSIKWALFQLGGLTLMAYVLTLVVYQIGRLFGG